MPLAKALCVCVTVQTTILGLYFTVPMTLHNLHRRQFVLSKMRASVKLLTTIKSLQAEAGHRPYVDGLETGDDDADVRRMFNATPPNHTIATISDTTILRFHIAILKKERMRSVNFDSIIGSLGQRDDLHAENDGEGGECPRGIDQCLAKSNSHSIGRESIVATMPLQESL